MLSFFEERFPCSIPRQQQEPDLDVDPATQRRLNATIRQRVATARTTTLTVQQEPDLAPLIEHELTDDDVGVQDEIVVRDLRRMAVPG